jgi:hypothetical protein
MALPMGQHAGIHPLNCLVERATNTGMRLAIGGKKDPFLCGE